MERLENRCFLSAAPLDPSFAANGVLVEPTSNVHSATAAGHAMLALQTDGKIVLASTILRGTIDTRVARYRANGKPDFSFGNRGAAILNPGVVDAPVAIAAAADGGILVLVSSASGDMASRSTRLLRLRPNGQRDQRFADKGWLVLDPASRWRRISTMDDGSILLDDLESKVLRLDARGRVDLSFGTDGLLTLDRPRLPTPPPGSTLRTGASDSDAPKFSAVDRKFVGVCSLDSVAVNDAQAVTSDLHTLIVRRYTPMGRRDVHFGKRGEVSIDMKSASGRDIDSTNISDFQVLENGKIVVSGHIKLAGLQTSIGFVLQLSSSGAVDRDFGRAGFFWTPHRINKLVAAQDSGVAFLARVPQPQNRDDVLVGSLNARGRARPFFGVRGEVVIDFGAFDYPESLIMQRSGGLLVLASRSTITPEFEFISEPVVARIKDCRSTR